MAPRHYVSYIKLTYVSRTYLKKFKNSKLGPSTECSDDAPTTDTSQATAKLTSVFDNKNEVNANGAMFIQGN